MGSLGTGDFLAMVFVLGLIGSVVFMLVRLVLRMRKDDVEVAHRWSDQVVRGKGEQTPEEAVEEWERKHRKRRWFRRP